MRTYQSSGKKKATNKKVLYSVFLALSIVAIATIITLSLTLGKDKVPPVEQVPPPTDEIPVDIPPVDTKPTFKVPMLEFTLGKMASLDRVVFSSSMGYWRTHNGMDFLGDAGADVYAVSAGTVIAVQHTTLEASIVTIQHTDGLVSYYKGLDTNIAVAVGDTVATGAKLGVLAATMPIERNDGPHLHLEMKLNNKFIDPLNYLAELANK